MFQNDTSLESACQPPHELDAIITSILNDQRLLNTSSDDLDLDQLLQDQCPTGDVMEDVLNPPPQEDADSCLGSPPLLPPGIRADPGLVTRDHSYLGSSSDHICDFAPPSDSCKCENLLISLPLHMIVFLPTAPSPPADVPLYLGQAVDAKREAPGPMRHSRRCRNSGSGSSLPYTVQDLSPPSPASYEEENSRGRRSNAGSDDGALGSPVRIVQIFFLILKTFWIYPGSLIPNILCLLLIIKLLHSTITLI